MQGNVTGNGSQLNIGATAGNAITISGQINNGTGTVQIAAGNSGGTGIVTLSGSGNSWGRTELNNGSTGTLRMGAVNVLPTATTLSFGTSTGNGNSTVELRGFNTTIGQLTSGVQSGGILSNNSATSATLTISGSDSSSAAFSGVIQDGGTGAFSLTRSGTGTTSLSGANTYTGATSITGGALNIQNATGLGGVTAGTTVSSGANCSCKVVSP